MFSFGISPCSQEFGREQLIQVAHYLSNEGKLAFCNLVLNGGDVKEPLPYFFISYSFKKETRKLHQLIHGFVQGGNSET